MKIVRRVLIAVAALVLLAAALVGVVWFRTAPEPPGAGTESRARLAHGPQSVGKLELEWVDTSRPTAANGDQPASPERRFAVTLWYPEAATGKHPLAVYSHGFLSSRHGGAYHAEHLASHGYVVVSADYPLSHGGAPGGPNFLDVVNQPADVSFLIDRALALDGADRPFEGEIDTQRIGVFGLSLGGITSTLVAFHPEWRDPRVAAAISIAGPADVLGPAFFDHAAVPFLMIAGTSDAIIDYELNALPIPARARTGALLSIAGGTHVGFVGLAAGLFRLLGNPDRVACRAAFQSSGDADPESSENAFLGLFGSLEQGLLEPAEYRPGCTRTFDRAIKAGRQQMITKLAVHAFFESRFATDAAERAGHVAFLTRTLPVEMSEVTYTPSRR